MLDERSVNDVPQGLLSVDLRLRNPPLAMIFDEVRSNSLSSIITSSDSKYSLILRARERTMLLSSAFHQKRSDAVRDGDPMVERYAFQITLNLLEIEIVDGYEKILAYAHLLDNPESFSAQDAMQAMYFMVGQAALDLESTYVDFRALFVREEDGVEFFTTEEFALISAHLERCHDVVTYLDDTFLEIVKAMAEHELVSGGGVTHIGTKSRARDSLARVAEMILEQHPDNAQSAEVADVLHLTIIPIGLEPIQIPNPKA